MQTQETNQPNIDYITANNTIRKSVVYIVDDDQDDRILGYNALRKSDRVMDVRPVKCADSLFKCFKNSGLYESFSFAEYHTPIILLDLHMPETNGLEALERIRYHPITAEFPVILLTTDNSAEKIYDAYRLNANGYLEKPFNLSQFHDVMDRVNTGTTKINFSHN